MATRQASRRLPSCLVGGEETVNELAPECLVGRRVGQIAHVHIVIDVRLRVWLAFTLTLLPASPPLAY